MGKSLLRALDTCGRSPALNPTMLAFASLAEVRTFRPCSVDTAVAPAAAVAALELDQVTVFPPAAAAAALDLDQEQVCRGGQVQICGGVTLAPGAGSAILGHPLPALRYGGVGGMGVNGPTSGPPQRAASCEIIPSMDGQHYSTHAGRSPRFLHTAAPSAAAAGLMTASSSRAAPRPAEAHAPWGRAPRHHARASGAAQEACLMTLYREAVQGVSDVIEDVEAQTRSLQVSSL